MEAAASGGGGGNWFTPGEFFEDKAGEPEGKAIADSMADFHAAAMAGHITVNESGGQALINFAQDIKDWYREHQAGLEQAAQPPKLGTSYAARVVSPFMAQVGQDEHGYVPNMQALAQTMDKFIESIQQSMTNYREAEESNAGTLRASGDGLDA